MKKNNFEQAMQRLEKIVEELELGKLSLAESLDYFEEGIKLSNFCQKELSNAEARVALVIKNYKGSFELQDFNE